MSSSLSPSFKALFLLLILFRLTSTALTFTPQEQQWIAEHPVVTLGADLSWPPYDFLDKEEHHTGIAADFLRLISDRSGLRFDVKADVWSSVMRKMADGEIDGLTCAVKTPEREKSLDFTLPYVSMPLALIVQKARRDIHSVDDLDGMVVAVNKGSYLHEWLVQEHPTVKLLLSNSNDSALEAVSFSKADAYIGNIAVAEHIMKKHYLSNLKIVSKVADMNTDVSVAIDKDKPLLFSIIAKSLADISREERVRIAHRWYDGSGFGSDRLGTQKVEHLTLTDAERRWIREHPVLTYSETDWIPMSIIKDGTMTGILGEYLGLIAEATGLTFKYLPVASWPDALKSFEERKIDLLPGVGENAYESSLGLTSKTFATFPFVLVTKIDRPFIDGIDEIADDDKSIAVPKYWSSYNYLVTKRPDIRIIETTGVIEALELVRTGKAYAFLGHRAIAMHYVGNNYPNELHIAGKIEHQFDHQFLFHREDSILKSIVDKAIDSITEDERLAIRHKWLTVKVETARDFSFLWKYLVLTLFLFGLFIYWNRKLSREVIRRRDSEEALKVEKENFKVLFEKVADGNLIIKHGHFVMANDAALKMLGLDDLSQLLASTPAQWSPTLQSDGQMSTQKVETLIENCMKVGHERFEWTHLDVDGEAFWVDVGLSKITYQGEDAIYVVWRDISEQKALEESLKQSESQIRTLLDLIPLHVIVTSHDGRILKANPQTSKVLGLTEEELLGRNVLELYEDPTDRDSMIESLHAHGKVDKEIVRFRHHDGSVHAMMLSILPMAYGGQSALLSIAIDMTDRLEMEESLLKAKEVADMANRSKSEFLANMSHEIRTPMNAIIGFTELLSEQGLGPRERSYVKTIQSASKTLLTLINDILDLSKIEAGRLEIETRPTDLSVLCEEVGSVFMMNAKKKGVEIVVDVDDKVPASLLVDPVRLRQILLNLVGNAVKFTEHGQIRLGIVLSRSDDHLSKVDLELKVEDSGIGIPKDQLDHIFDDFAQRDGQDNRRYGGTGLGLSISRRLSEMMGGEILVESQIGVGTTFRVMLSGVDIATVQPESDLQDETSSTMAHTITFEPAKVLVVDDNEANRQLLIDIFRDTAIEVVTADDGLEAISQYEAEKPDLILMDIRMPNMDGYEATSKIKSDADVPIVALTASVMEDVQGESKKDAFDDYLRKPIQKRELFRSLSRFLVASRVAKEDVVAEPLRLSNKARSNLAVVLRALDEEITPIYDQATKSNNISEMKRLASELHRLASQYDVAVLEKFASSLDESIDAFDISQMQELLQEFPGVEKRLSSLR